MTEGPVKKTKILVVEDEAVIGMHIQNSLRQLGYDVCGSASSGDEAIRIAEECRPDLILMDIVLQGGMDGIEAASIIRERFGIPVVYMTGNADIPTITRARGTDPYGYILKPIDVLHMFSTIDTIMHRRDLEMRLAESEERFRAISENIQEGIALAIDYKNAWVNDAFAGIFGYTKDELVGRGPDQLIHPDDMPEIMKIGGEMIKGMPTGFAVARARRKDGVEILIEVNGRLFVINETPAILLIVRDVTERRRAEEALQMLGSAVDQTIDGVSVADLDGNIIYANRAWASMHGLSDADIAGCRMSLFHSEGQMRDDVLPFLEEVRLHGSHEGEVGHRRKNGEEFPTFMTATLLRDERGFPYRFVGTARDITSQKKAELRLRESEEKYRRLVEEINDVVFTFDEKGIITFISFGGVSQSGFNEKDLFGKNFIDLVCPEDRQKVLEQFAYRKEGGSGSYDARIINKLGKPVWVHVSARPIIVDGVFRGARGILTNIDEKKRAEEALRLSEEKYRSLVEEINDVILSLDEKGLITFASSSAEGLTGYAPLELMGRYIMDLIYPEDINQVVGRTENRLHGVGGTTEFRIVTKSGIPLWVSASGKPVILDGVFKGIRGVLTNIDERKRAEEALRESEERFRRISTNLPGTVFQFSIGPDSKIIVKYVSERSFEVFGLERDPLETFFSRGTMCVHPDDREGWMQTVNTAIQDHTEWDWEGRFINPAGSEMWLKIIGQPTIIGEEVTYNGIVLDITDRKLAELMMRRSEERFRSISTNLPGIVYQFYTRDNGEQGMYYVDDRCKDIYGIEGHPLESFFGRFMERIHPDDKESFLSSVNQVIKESSTWDWEGRYLHPDGREMWIKGISQPVSSENELVFNGLMLDITDRKLAELKMRQSEERFRSISTNLPGVVYQFYARDNGENGLYYVDERARDLWEIEIEPLDSFMQRFTEHLHPDDRGGFLSSISEAVRTVGTWDWEGRYLHPGGREIWFRGISRPVRAGNEVVFNGLMLDITDQKLAELQLQDSEVKFRSLVDNLQDATIIMNTEGIVVFENPRTKEMLGYSLLGMRGFDIVHPDDLKTAADAFSEVIKKTNRHIPTLFRVRHADGSWLYMEALASNLLDIRTIPGLLLVCRDVTGRIETEMALRQSEERYRTLFDQSPVGVFLFDKDLVIRECNDHFTEMMQTSREQIVGFHSGTQRENAVIPYMRETIKGKPSSWEGWYRSPSNNMAYYHSVNYSPLRDAEGNVVGGIAVVSDLTDRKRAEKALQESEERYRALFNQSPLGILQFDNNLIVTGCNERLAMLLGSTREKMMGVDLHLLREAAVIERMKDTIDGRSVSYQGVYHAITSDEVLYISVNTSPLRDGNGFVIGGMGVIEDVTDRKMAEKQLQLSEERNRLLVENANESIVVIQDWKFVFTNPRFISLTGYSVEEFAAKRFTEFVHPDDREMITGRYLKRLEGDTTPLTYEIRFFNKAGEVRWTEVNSVRIIWEKKTAALLFIRDITERKNAEEERRKIEAQIQQTQKLESLGVLAGGIAHDFNNLLMAILGNIDLALMDTSASSPTRGNLLEAAKASQRAADLCRQMLAYSGRGRFTSEALDMNEIVEDMKHMLEVSISKKAVLRYNFAAGIPAVEADVTQVRQIIMNLVINASDAIGQKSGVISISTGVMTCDRAYLSETWLNENLPEGMYVYIEVVDTGCGIDSANLPNIFDPFYTTKFTGRGLGLAAVLGIVRGHRGAIKVYSEKGKGTTFKVLFPAADRDAERVSWKREVGDDWRGSGTILLADDEETIRVLGRRMLERFGFTVLTAENGREAIDIFRENPDGIRCVILDLTMPHMDGEEAFRELRRIRKDACVIMSSGYNEQEINQRFAGKGIAGFIQKPYQMSELASKLRYILG